MDLAIRISTWTENMPPISFFSRYFYLITTWTLVIIDVFPS